MATATSCGVVLRPRICRTCGMLFWICRHCDRGQLLQRILVWIFYAAQTAALIVLRSKEPNMPRPYKTWGYPVLPILFILGALH